MQNVHRYIKKCNKIAPPLSAKDAFSRRKVALNRGAKKNGDYYVAYYSFICN